MSEHVIATPATCPYKTKPTHESVECPVCDWGLDVCLKCDKVEGELFDACTPQAPSQADGNCTIP